jgi:hypothetical protein
MRYAAVIIMMALSASFVLAQTDDSKRKVLIEEKILSTKEYRITARGYAKPGLTDSVQIRESAQEAAVLNAQVLARQKFKENIDVIRNGTARSFNAGNDYCDVQYIITYPGIKYYLRDKKP